MSDYRVRISVRNARLLRAIEKAGYQPGQKFAEIVGINYQTMLLPYLNLTRSPLTPEGLLREDAWDLCDFLNASPSDLWSDSQLQPLEKNHASADIDAESVQALIHGSMNTDPFQIVNQLEAAEIIKNEVIKNLSPRRAQVISMRYLKGMTFQEVASELNLTRERVRQIEKDVFRKLRHPKHQKLRDVAEAYD